MNNLYKRPMFRKGGSAEGGITSGLQRPGYKVGERVTEVMDEMQSIRPQRNTAKRRLGDLMIDFGIDIASRTPTGSGIGGAISTTLASAKDPFDKFRQSRAADEGFEDKLALGAYDVVKGEQAAEKEFGQKKELIKLESELNPKLKKVFREEIPEVRINEYADSLEENDFDFIKNNSREIASDIVTYNVFKEKNPDSGPAKKDFRGILPYEYDKKGFEFASKQDALSKLQDGQDVITQQITEIQTMPASPQIDVSVNQEKIKQLQRELQKNQQLQKLITGEDDMIGETILKSIAADTGDFDLNDYMEYKKDPDAFLKKLREAKADGGRIGLNLGGMSNTPMMTGMVEEVQETGTTDPVADLSYGELRARLPKEITDDVVTTIANSKQALLDFANIRTQQDVDEFNQQYNVNLVLPQEG